jgi:hypothetical protein
VIYHLLASFFLPYTIFLQGAAYSLHQILEGLGVASSSFPVHDTSGRIINGYWSADEGIIPTLGALVLLTICLMPLAGAAFYTLGKRKGLLIFIAVICIPGVLNCFGHFPNIRYLPSRYVFHGTGTLGSETGMIPLLMLSFISGWATIILIYDNFNLTEKFRQIYDHFWFPTALVAAVFFVADNGASEDTQDMANSTNQIQEASLYLLNQIKRYDDYCKANTLNDLKSCKWSQYAQYRFTEISRFGSEGFIQSELDSSANYYALPNRAIPPEDIIVIRKEIAAYNDKMCPVKYYSSDIRQPAPLSSICDSTPYQFCADKPDGPNGLVDKNVTTNTVALASECIIPRLASSKNNLIRLSDSVNQHKKAKNYRWLYFIGIAFAVGGKVALSTTKLSSMDTRTLTDRRVIFRATARKFSKLVRLFKSLVVWLFRALLRQMRKVLRRIKQYLEPC